MSFFSFLSLVCKTCIVDHIKSNKHCPICDTQIHKTKPFLSMRPDKALQNIVYKLVPGLYQDEMEKRKKFQEKHEPTKVPKEELEKHFFFCDDKISMSLEYYDTSAEKKLPVVDTPKDDSNPNKRYLACPGTVKIQHLTKFIVMKYGLECDTFVVDVIYKGDVIPDDYTLIDVAYYYKWEKDSPMQFFYRIFKKNKVLLKRRKRKSRTEDKISDGKKPRPVECTNNASPKAAPNPGGKQANLIKEDANHNSKNGSNGTDIIGCRTVSAVGGAKATTLTPTINKPPALQDETAVKRKHEPKPEVDKSPPTLTAAVTKKEEVNKGFATTTDDDDEEDSDHEPSEKKLKIDLDSDTSIQVKVTENDVKVKSTSHHSNDVLKVKPNKIGLSDVKVKPSVVPHQKSEVKKVEPKPEKKSESFLPKIEDLINGTKSSSKSESKPKSPEIIKPKLTNGSKPRMLTDIVNNLAKKQTTNLSQQTKDTSSTNGVPVPPSLLGGQTTITKKLLEGDIINKSNKKEESIITKESKKDSKSDVKGIPSETSVTVRSILPASTGTSASSSSGSTSGSTSTLSFSNTFKQKNGSTSMMDFVQATSPALGSSTKVPSSPTNGLNKKPGSVLSDLRQFRKVPSGSSPTEQPQPQQVNGSSPKSSVNPSNRTPIIPALTSKSLTFGTNKLKTSSPSSPKKEPSAFSAALSKPIPKPAATTASILAQQNALNTMAALSLSTLGFNDQQKALQYINAAAMMAAGLNNLPAMNPPQPQLPSNRLKLTVNASSSSSSKPTPTNSNNPMQLLPSLASHMAPDASWKMFSPLASNGTSPSSTSLSTSLASNGSSKLSSLKTLNQSIRQIPNPSLLTNKQNSSDQLLQRAIASQAAVAAIANSARTSLSN